MSDAKDRKEIISKAKKSFASKFKPQIRGFLKETTAGGIIYRIGQDGKIEVLLVSDARKRWTIPKGHVEPGEITRETAKREITEETGLQEMRVHEQLGKTSFQFRRGNNIILMNMHVYLVEALGNTDGIAALDDWMTGIGWFKFSEAIDMIHYEGVEALMIQALRKIRDKHS
jgi:ADP-ribose pyrophosphatase YjhB (NUDIX family)